MSSYVLPPMLEKIKDFYLLDCSFSTKNNRTSDGETVLEKELRSIYFDCLAKMQYSKIPYMVIMVIAFNSENANDHPFTKGIWVETVRITNPDFSGMSYITEEKEEEKEEDHAANIQVCMDLFEGSKDGVKQNSSDVSPVLEQHMNWEEYSNNVRRSMERWTNKYCTKPWLTFDVIKKYLKTNNYDRDTLVSITLVTDGVMSTYTRKNRPHNSLTDEFKFFFGFLENYSYIFRLIVINIKVSLSDSEEEAVTENKHGADVYDHIEHSGALDKITFYKMYDKDYNSQVLIDQPRYQPQHVRWNGNYFNINDATDMKELFDSIVRIVSTTDPTDSTQQSSLVGPYITMILDLTKNCRDIEKKARIRMCLEKISHFSRKVLMEIAQGVKNESVFLKDRYLAKQDFFKNTTNSLMQGVTDAVTSYIPTNGMIWLYYDSINQKFTFGIIRSDMVGHTIRIGSNEYKDAAYTINITVDDNEETKYFLCIPIVNNFEDNNDTIGQYQAIRQWVRNIISIYFRVNTYSDLVIFIWMFLNLVIQHSDASDLIKETFKNITLILLSKESIDKQSLLTNLVGGSLITVSNSESSMIVHALMVLQEIFGFTEENCLEPMTMWLMLCSGLDYRNLMNNQRKWSLKALQLDYEKYGIEDIGDFVRHILDIVRMEITEADLSSIEYSYTDIINFVDTSDTGGFILDTHGPHGCRYLCVTTQETVELLDRCPWCRQRISPSDWTPVDPMPMLDIIISNSLYDTNEFPSCSGITQSTPVLPYTKDEGILVNKSFRSRYRIHDEGKEESKGSGSLFSSSSSVMSASRMYGEPSRPTSTRRQGHHVVIEPYTLPPGVTIERLTIRNLNSSMGPTCKIGSDRYDDNLDSCTIKRPYTIPMLMLLWEHLVKTGRTEGTCHWEVKAFNYAKLYNWVFIEDEK